MRVTILGLIGVMAIGAGLLRSASQDASSASPSLAPQRAILDQYCVTCHNEKLKTAGLMLDRMNLGEVSENASVWEKVVRKVRT
ncbi:MAG: hypothetical protein IH935_06485, partial [Acidobacteria bacterium]|nr:hypothetical protein [Acidobacteriota bacterium]